MDEKIFLEKMKNILDNEDVTMDSPLEAIEEWDSLSIVSYAALANGCGRSVTFPQVRECTTIRDLYALLMKKND
ncbi:MAG: hypothetical protein K5841_07705 [Fretibacterium sp.]|nr:hypothetical protein [Fretibacterium sp.]